MSPIYKAARQAYKANEFAALSIRQFEEGSSDVAVYDKNGKFLQLFASRVIAEREVEAQSAKARKYIS